MYMYVHLCVHVCMYVYVWRPEVNFGYFPPLLCTILFRVGTFTKLRSRFLSKLSDWLTGQQTPGVCLSLLPLTVQLQMHTATPGFYVGVRDLNSSSHACLANIFILWVISPTSFHVHIFFNFWDGVFLIWFLITFIYCEYTYMCERIIWQELVLSFQDVGPWEQTQVVRLGS